MVVVKDNIDTADMLTTAGSLALADRPPSRRRPARVGGCARPAWSWLRKTNLSEWANIRDPGSTSGWSAYGGLTRNPVRPEPLGRWVERGQRRSGRRRGWSPFAIGTETDGSITCPAAFNGCVGIKPTVGLLPDRGDRADLVVAGHGRPDGADGR